MAITITQQVDNVDFPEDVAQSFIGVVITSSGYIFGSKLISNFFFATFKSVVEELYESNKIVVGINFVVKALIKKDTGYLLVLVSV